MPVQSELRDRYTDPAARQAPGLEGDDRLHERLRTLAHELTLAEARERSRIAQGLHDDIGQLLAVARFKLQELQYACTPEQVEPLTEIQGLLGLAAKATRSATFDLCNPALSLGLDEALRSLAQRLTRMGTAVFQVEGQMPALSWSQAVLSVLYRVTRELAVNAQRHARARQVWIRLQHDKDGLRISVCDDGVGIDPAWSERGLSPEGGYGLVSAQAQMLALGGSLQLESGIGSGTLATLGLPDARAGAA